MIATIGIDLQSGQARYTMGIPSSRTASVSWWSVVGLFAIAEVFRGMEGIYRGTAPGDDQDQGQALAYARGVATLDRADLARRRHRLRDRRAARRRRHHRVDPVLHHRKAPVQASGGVRQGRDRGRGRPRSGEQRRPTGGRLVPLLCWACRATAPRPCCSVPSSCTALQPGPLLIQNRPRSGLGLVASMYVGNVMLLILNLPLIGLFVRLLYIPSGISIR
jgi:putative tricarboxylic transport membrane protein